MANEGSLLGTFQDKFALSDLQLSQLQNFMTIENLPPAEAFERLGISDESRILRILAEYFQLPFLEREDYPEKPVFLESVSMNFLRKHAVLPVQMESGKVTVVVNNPLDVSLLNLLGSYFDGMQVSLQLGLKEEILNALDRLFGTAAREAEALSRNDGGAVTSSEGFEDDLEHLRGLAQEAPIIRLVNVTISRSLDMRASDIHFASLESPRAAHREAKRSAPHATTPDHGAGPMGPCVGCPHLRPVGAPAHTTGGSLPIAPGPLAHTATHPSLARSDPQAGRAGRVAPDPPGLTLAAESPPPIRSPPGLQPGRLPGIGPHRPDHRSPTGGAAHPRRRPCRDHDRPGPELARAPPALAADRAPHRGSRLAHRSPGHGPPDPSRRASGNTTEYRSTINITCGEGRCVSK